MACRYHYHLGFHLPHAVCADLRQRLAPIAQPEPTDRAMGQSAPLFFSLVVIAQAALQHPFLRQRCAAAFDRPLPPAVDFHFRRISVSKNMAQLAASGNPAAADQLITQLAEYLAAQGVTLPAQPHGARPQVTIGAAIPPQADDLVDFRWQWTPMELALIEVDAHNHQQRTLHRWRLSSPIQPSFLFDIWDDAA